jgi:hypothetical protein
LCYGGDTDGVGELHGGADEPGRDDRPDRHVPRAGGDADAVRLRVEPRSRAEYAAYLDGRVPRPVTLDVSSLLGPDGQRYCTGWRLQPVDGSMDLAREQRAAWAKARSRDGHTDMPEPDARRRAGRSRIR